MSDRYGCEDKDIGHYTCRRTTERIVVDGELSETCWQRALKSPRFVDMVTGVPGFLDTRMAALWDDANLYIAFWVEEPNVQAHFTQRDSPVYFENDVEVFIAGKDWGSRFKILRSKFSAVFRAPSFSIMASFPARLTSASPSFGFCSNQSLTLLFSISQFCSSFSNWASAKNNFGSFGTA